MTITTLVILIICGVIVNMMSALFGIGGGVLMVPMLRTLFPALPIQVVAACSLTIVMGSALINLLFFRRQAIPISKKNVVLWSLGMIVGVQIGFELSFLFSDRLITAIFMLTLFTLALKTLFHRPSPHTNDLAPFAENLKGITACGFGGLVAGITGIGGGSIMAPLVAQIRSVSPKQVAVYTNYMMIFGGIGNLYGYLSRPFPFAAPEVARWQIGYVNVAIVGTVIAASLLTARFSMRLRNRLSPERTTKLLGLILFGIAGYMGVLQYVFRL